MSYFMRVCSCGAELLEELLHDTIEKLGGFND